MKLLKTITDADFGLNNPVPLTYTEYITSRAVLFDAHNNIAMIHSVKNDWHVLPGGRVQDGENLIDACKRELLEETGCSIKNIRELGTTEEYRNEAKIHQVSHCFLADLDGEKGIPDLEDDEIEMGFEPVWMSLDKAIEILENELSDTSSQKGKFTYLRNLIFLKEAKNYEKN